MISGGPCADAGMFVDKEILLRGARASPTSSLGVFKNIAGMCKDRVAMARIPGDVETVVPFVKRAHEMLNEDPIDPKKVELARSANTGIRTSDRWSEHLKHLQYEVGLLEDHAEDELDPLIVGRYTAVWKDVDTEPPIARAIMDLRRLNALCKDDGVPFEILGSGGIVEKFKELDPTKQWGIVHADVANAYYQMGTGPKLKQRMLLRWGNKFVQSLALAMGFTHSCGIAQGICAGLILLQQPGDKDLGIDPRYYSSETAPGYMRLNNGGFVILVYDSILVVCPKKDVVAWHGRLRRNFESIGKLVLKYCEIAEDGEVVPYCGVEIKAGPNIFQWRVADGTLRTWATLRTLAVKSTPRTLFTIVGFLRFALDVQGSPRRVLGRVSHAQSVLGKVLFWDAEIVKPEEIERAWKVLDELLVKRQSESDWQHKRSHIPRKRKGTQIRFVIVAVDATPLKYAAAILQEDGVVGGNVEGCFDYFTPIAEAECTAAKAGLCLVGAVDVDVVVQCNDHKAVGRGFWKGYSPQDLLDSLIVEGLDAVDGKVLVQVDVPSAENFADIATRPDKNFSKEEKEERMRMSLARGQEALRTWKRTGKDYFSREDFSGATAVKDVELVQWRQTLEYDSTE